MLLTLNADTEMNGREQSPEIKPHLPSINGNIGAEEILWGKDKLFSKCCWENVDQHTNGRL